LPLMSRPISAPLGTPHEQEGGANATATLWTPEVASLARGLIVPRQRRPIRRFPASSVAEVSGKKQVNVLAVLARVDDFLRRKNMRVIDLFRDASINTSLEATVAAAKRVQGRWKSGAAMRAHASAMDDMLSASELSGFLKNRLEMRLTPVEVAEVVRFLDVNGNGEVDPQEMQQALRAARRWSRGRRGQSAASSGRSGRSGCSSGQWAAAGAAAAAAAAAAGAGGGGGGAAGNGASGGLDRNARLARAVERGALPAALHVDEAVMAARAAELRRRGIITPFAPAAPRGRKVDFRPRFGCGERASRRDAKLHQALGDGGRGLQRSWKAPAYMRSTRTAGSAEHVLLRLDRAMRERGASATQIFASRDGGVCDVLTPAELLARLSRLGLGLDAAVVSRCVAAMCSGGGTHSAGGRAGSSHLDIGSFQLELKGARRHAAQLFARADKAAPMLARDPDVLAALRGEI